MTNFVFPIEELIEKSAVRTAEIVLQRLTGLNSPEPEELLSADEACEILKCSRPTLWRNEKEGKVKGYGISGKRYYKRSELLESLIQKK